jgi:hypothetical protein
MNAATLRAPDPFRKLADDLREAAAAFGTDAVTARCRGAEVGMDPDAAEELSKLLTLAGAALTLLLGKQGSAA